jgi:hypothetical protein
MNSVLMEISSGRESGVHRYAARVSTGNFPATMEK